MLDLSGRPQPTLEDDLIAVGDLLDQLEPGIELPDGLGEVLTRLRQEALSLRPGAGGPSSPYGQPGLVAGKPFDLTPGKFVVVTSGGYEAQIVEVVDVDGPTLVHRAVTYQGPPLPDPPTSGTKTSCRSLTADELALCTPSKVCASCGDPILYGTLAQVAPANKTDLHKADDECWRHSDGGAMRTGTRLCILGAARVAPAAGTA